MIKKVYIVNQKFDYNGERFRPGDEWIPQGGRWDELIVNSLKVREETVREDSPDYGDLKVSQLRKKLEDRGLAVSGKKAELVLRLQRSDEFKGE